MEETTGQFVTVRELGEHFEVSLNEELSILNHCWQEPRTVIFEAKHGEERLCSRMAWRAVTRMAEALNIPIENQRISTEIEILSYLIELAQFGSSAWKPPTLEQFRVSNEIVGEAREQVLEELRTEHKRATTDEAVVLFSDLKVISVHENLLSHLKVVCDTEDKLHLPISHSHFSQITDLIYSGKCSFARKDLAGVVAASCFTNFDEIIELSEILRRKMKQNFLSTLSIEALKQLNSVALVTACVSEQFELSDEDRKIIQSNLMKWTEENCGARQTAHNILVTVLDRNTTSTAEKDYTNYIYYNGFKFDGCLWTVSELHKISSKHFSFTNAVVNSKGDMIVSSRPGPLGILSAEGKFTHTNDIPHDPLGYGYPFNFQHFPFVCLVFEVRDQTVNRYVTELWLWKEREMFEPIKMSVPWSNVGGMVRVNESGFYLTARRAVGPRRADAGGEDLDDAGLFRMNIHRTDGILHGEVELIEKWTCDEYCEKFTTEFFYTNGSLFKEEREHQFGIAAPVRLSRLTEEGEFVAADEFQPVKGATLRTWTLNGRIFAVASLYDESNSANVCGFFEFTKSEGWKDRTLETGFHFVYPKWRPQNDRAWRHLELLS